MWWEKIRRLWTTTDQQNGDDSSQHRGHLHRERGQSLVEFAIILPVLLLLVVATIDLGMGFKTYITLTNASREGVRWITIHPTDQTGARARVAEEASNMGLSEGLFLAGGYEVLFSPDQSDYAAGENVMVSVTYDYELLFGAITGLPSIPFTASSTMVVLYDE